MSVVIVAISTQRFSAGRFSFLYFLGCYTHVSSYCGNFHAEIFRRKIFLYFLGNFSLVSFQDVANG